MIYRREIPVMIGVFVSPGRRPDQPEATPREWGDRTTNRPREYNSLDDKYARVIVDELRIPNSAAWPARVPALSPPSPSPGTGRTSSAKC